MNVKYIVITKVKSVIDRVYGPYDSYVDADKESVLIKKRNEQKYATKIQVTVRQIQEFTNN